MPNRNHKKINHMKIFSKDVRNLLLKMYKKFKLKNHNYNQFLISFYSIIVTLIIYFSIISESKVNGQDQMQFACNFDKDNCGGLLTGQGGQFLILYYEILYVPFLYRITDFTSICKKKLKQFLMNNF